MSTVSSILYWNGMQEPLMLSGGAGSETAGEIVNGEEPVVEEFDLSDILSESVDQSAKSKADLLADIEAETQASC